MKELYGSGRERLRKQIVDLLHVENFEKNRRRERLTEVYFCQAPIFVWYLP